MLTFMAVHLFKFRFAVADQYWRSTDFGHHWFHVARVHDHSPCSSSMVVSAAPDEVVDAKTGVEQHPVAA